MQSWLFKKGLVGWLVLRIKDKHDFSFFFVFFCFVFRTKDTSFFYAFFLTNYPFVVFLLNHFFYHTYNVLLYGQYVVRSLHILSYFDSLSFSFTLPFRISIRFDSYKINEERKRNISRMCVRWYYRVLLFIMFFIFLHPHRFHLLFSSSHSYL